jgi:hypothetical protein
MSIEAVAWAKAQRIASAPQKLLYILLADRISNETGTCFPGQELLAEEATMCARSVRTHLNALEATYYIKRSKRFKPDGSPTSDKYEFPGFKEWLGAVKTDAREVHEKHASSRQEFTTGRNLPPVDLGASHRQVSVATTGRNLPPNPKKNPKKNPQSSAQQAAPDTLEVASPEEKAADLKKAPFKLTATETASGEVSGKRKKSAAKGSDAFEAAWTAYKAASTRTPGSKPKALAQFAKLTAADQALVPAAIQAYRADCEKSSFGRGDHRHMADMNRFFTDFFRQFADDLTPAKTEASERKIQVLALALDLADRTWTRSIRWWGSVSNVPDDILTAAKKHASDNFDGFQLQAT